MSMLFADIRGSTSLAETMPPGEYRALLDRFYNVAADAVFANDGFLDKFVGDEVVATFAPLLAGEQHASRAVDAARALHGHTRPRQRQPAVAATRRRRAYRHGLDGSRGRWRRTRTMTALGDAVNVAARLASLAEAGRDPGHDRRGHGGGRRHRRAAAPVAGAEGQAAADRGRVDAGQRPNGDAS